MMPFEESVSLILATEEVTPSSTSARIFVLLSFIAAAVVFLMGLTNDFFGLLDRYHNYRLSRFHNLPSRDEMKKSFKTIVIDDDNRPYVKELKREGFQVTREADLTKYADVDEFQYEVVLLDIQGVGAKVGADDGLAILASLKGQSPSQIVLVYSSREFGIDVVGKAKLADEVIPKTSSNDYPAFRSALERHYARLLDPALYIPSDAQLNSRHRRRLERWILDNLAGRQVPRSKVSRVLSAKSLTPDSRMLVERGCVHAQRVGAKVATSRVGKIGQ